MNERPRWSPDSRQIYFVSNRGGSQQIWVMDADGSHSRQITHLSTEAGGVLVSPDGKKIVFLSSVYPECGADDACNKRKLDEEAKSKVKARIYTSLLYPPLERVGEQAAPALVGRQRRRHRGEGSDAGLARRASVLARRSGRLRDLARFDRVGLRHERRSGAGAEHQLRYLTRFRSTAAMPRKITTGLGADNSPLYSPDGKYLAFRSQARAGYESDRWRLMVLDRATGRSTNLTEGLDRWVDSITWSPDSTRLFFTVEDRGRTGLQMIPATGGGSRNIISGSSSLDDVQFTSDGRTMIYTEESGSRPAEIFRVNSSGGNGSGADAFERRAAFRRAPDAARRNVGGERRQDPRSFLRREAAGFSETRKVSRCCF